MNFLRRTLGNWLFPGLRRVLNQAGGGIRDLELQLEHSRDQNSRAREAAIETAREIFEAESMRGSGPYMGPVRMAEAQRLVTERLRENFAELELAMDDRGWQRMNAYALYEFSRYGIQQIILASRLYFIKNPLIRRGVMLTGYYVFGRGIEIRSLDETANAAIQEFLARNEGEFSHIGLAEKERSRHTDGNLFFAFFSDESTGTVDVRMIDPVEIVEVITDPDDGSIEIYIHRQWTQVNLDAQGNLVPTVMDKWYPSLDHAESGKPVLGTIMGKPVEQAVPVYHVKAGGLPKWHFGCPLVYSALDWARAYRGLMQDYCSIKKALARFSWNYETNGGNQAIAGIQGALTTMLGDGSGVDRNPPPVTGSVHVSGPGNVLNPIRTSGMTDNPDDARAIGQMVAAALDLPETMLFGRADVGNLATATTLDRPTELKFQNTQQIWREILTKILRYVLNRSSVAPSGKMKEVTKRLTEPDITIKFPTVLEHSLTEEVDAIVKAITLGTSEVQGIDLKTGIGLLFSVFQVENAAELLAKMFPEGTYEPDRTLEPEEPEPTPMQQLTRAAEALKEARKAHA